ncbi:hypothetical protein [Pseudomonas sp. BF-RE-26]|uniref:hypothetical protein n=1 Tax=Pseudomonas sp. BF-RE-26 TaxID=2832396 RepID=UPI001CBD4B3E|nr:hypothetical protein [Pseudomonas sp. BF-RE-26]
MNKSANTTAARVAAWLAAAVQELPVASLAASRSVTHEMQYGEMVETLPLKEWLVLPFKHDWDDLSRSREAREDLVRVWAATRGQAKYKAYERLQDYCHSIKAMLHFKVRRA